MSDMQCFDSAGHQIICMGYRVMCRSIITRLALYNWCGSFPLLPTTPTPFLPAPTLLRKIDGWEWLGGRWAECREITTSNCAKSSAFCCGGRYDGRHLAADGSVWRFDGARLMGRTRWESDASIPSSSNNGLIVQSICGLTYIDKIATETLFVGNDSHTHPKQTIRCPQCLLCNV